MSWFRSGPRTTLWLMLSLLLSTGGCSRESYYKKQVSWGYVHDIGSARDITRWTLAQDEPRKIRHGLFTLEALTVLRGRREAEDAVEGYLAVHRKILEGWPGLKEEPVSPVTGRPPQPLLSLSRRLPEGNVQEHPDDPEARELYRRMLELDPGAADELRRRKAGRELPPLFGEPVEPELPTPGATTTSKPSD